MADQFNYDVFLSHSVKDKPIVRELAERLRNDGLKVWLDEWVLKPGDHVQAKIEEGLEQSRVLVLCMSANAFGSDWAQLEAGTFRFRDPMNRERCFIPCGSTPLPSKARWRNSCTSTGCRRSASRNMRSCSYRRSFSSDNFIICKVTM